MKEIDGGYSVTTVAERREGNCVVRDLHIRPTRQRNGQVGLLFISHALLFLLVNNTVTQIKARLSEQVENALY